MYLFICLYYLNLFLFSKFLQKPIFALGGNEGRKVAKEEKICFALTLQYSQILNVALFKC